MKEIIELNAKILKEQSGPRGPMETLMFQKDELDQVMELSPLLQGELQSLLAHLKEVVPSDFNFTLFLGDESPTFTVQFQDGPLVEYSGENTWDPARSIIDQLKAYDWDGDRSQGMSMGHMMDEMKEEAKHQPSQLPSTKKLQKAFSEEMKEFIKAKRKDASKVHVMLFREGEGLQCETFESVDAFSRELPDMMTVHLLVITVVANGKPMPVENIDALKTRALDELEDMPISHAKAQFKIGGFDLENAMRISEMKNMAFVLYCQDVASVGSVSSQAISEYLAAGKICRGTTVASEGEQWFHIIKSPAEFPQKRVFFGDSQQELFSIAFDDGLDAGIPLETLFND